MDETKLLAAILTVASSARESRTTAAEIGKEHWRKVIKDYEQILTALKQPK